LNGEYIAIEKVPNPHFETWVKRVAGSNV